MLSRKQFGLVQTARGLTTDEIITRSGIPPQSFMVLMESDGRDGRDPSKLISESTFCRLAMTLGLEPGMAGLRTNSVIEWRVNPKQRVNWQEAVRLLRQDLFSEHFEMAVITHPSPFYSRKSVMIFLHDLDTDVKLVVTHGNMKTARFLKGLFAVESYRTVPMETKEFDFTLKLIENGVYRSNQFHIVLGGRKVRYTWGEVQAAAKEFNFTTDELIELMVSSVHQRIQSDSAISLVEPEVTSVEERPVLRIATGG